MYIQHIELQNVRGFLDGEATTRLDVPAAPGWFVFAGRNGSGKSTLLRAVALAIAGPSFVRQLISSFENWIRDGEAEATVKVSFLPDPNADQLTGSGRAPKNAMSVTLAWTRAEAGPEPSFSFEPQHPPMIASHAKKGGPKAAWRGPWSENPQGWLLVGYGPFRRLSGHAAEAQRAMVGPHHLRRLVSLFREDASLTEVVEWLKNERLRALEARPGAKELLSGVEALLNSGLLPDGGRVVAIDSTGVWVERQGSKVELRELSDGYRVALALILDIVRHMHDAYGSVGFAKTKNGTVFVDSPAVVLIDEVDAHLHVSWQQAIGEWLKARFPRVQFLVTTHSPFICQSASEDGLFRLPAPGEARGLEPVDADTFKQVVNGSVEDAVLSKLFGMERAFSERSEKLREEWQKLRARQLKGLLKSKEDRRRLEELTKQLPLPFDSVGE
jgi:hypothetical protein